MSESWGSWPATAGDVDAVRQAVMDVKTAVLELVVPRRELIAAVIVAGFAAAGGTMLADNNVGRAVEIADALIAELDAKAAAPA
jgi:hypothetical protein